MTDTEALARLKRGDISGLEALVGRYQLEAVRAAYLITRDRALAEDVVQGAFLRVYERIAGFDDARPFGPWFLRIVANDAVKAATRHPHLSLEAQGDAPDLPSPDPGLVERLEGLEQSEAIREALRQLTPEERAAIVLRYYLDLNSADVARRLGSTPGTVRWRLATARRRLRELLPAWLAPENGPEK